VIQSTPTRKPGTHGPLSACEPYRGQIAQWYLITGKNEIDNMPAGADHGKGKV